MSDFNLPNWTQPPTLQKCQSQVFHAKNAFCEHYGHNPIFGCFAFHVLKVSSANGILDIYRTSPKRTTNKRIIYIPTLRHTIYSLVIINLYINIVYPVRFYKIPSFGGSILNGIFFDEKCLKSKTSKF